MELFCESCGSANGSTGRFQGRPRFCAPCRTARAERRKADGAANRRAAISAAMRARPRREATCTGCGGAYTSQNPGKWCPTCASVVSKIGSRKYPLDIHGYWALHRAQGGVCAICGGAEPQRRTLNIDHCHTTGRVRGLLCTPCNLGIGHFVDDPARLARAADYVAR